MIVRRAALGWLMAAGAACVATGATGATPAPRCASDPPSLANLRNAEGGPAAFTDLRSSQLLTSSELAFKIARGKADGLATSMLQHRDPRGTASLAAVRWSFGTGAEGLVCVKPLWPAAAGRSAAEYRRAVLERLYELALHEDPEARFCLVEGQRGCAVTGARAWTHAQLLRHLASARSSVAGAGKAWRVVTLEPAGAVIEGTRVAARVSDARGPVAGASVFFHKAPHWGCAAKSGPDGVARCVLEDHHGDEESHEDEHEPVVVTFPGVVHTGHILLPTTLVMVGTR